MEAKHVDGDDYGYPPGVGSAPAAVPAAAGSANLREQLQQLLDAESGALRWVESVKLELSHAEAKLDRVRAEIARLTDGSAG